MAVVFHGISGHHWCPYAISITNNTTLVEFAKPRETTYSRHGNPLHLWLMERLRELVTE